MMTTPFDSDTLLKNMTTQPGIYQMLDASGVVLYVGKAKNLKKRLANYFQKNHDSAKTRLLVQKIQHIEVMITRNETEALLLENSLIKQHLPRFNVLLRDDKSYPYLFVSTRQDFPRLDFHRGTPKAAGRYFGPYPSSHAVRENLQLLQKIFKLRNCQDHFFANRTRPCLQYQIKRCTAPCVGNISKEAYHLDVNNAILFLEGKGSSLLQNLVLQMEGAAKALEFELAAKMRNQIASLRKLQEKQDVVNTHDKDMDVVALANLHALVCIQVLMIRGGRLLGNKTYFPKIPSETQQEEIAEAFLTQYYLNSKGRTIPPKIIINVPIQQQKTLMEVFSSSAKYKVLISTQVKADRARLMEMALRNAKQALILALSDKTTLYHRFEQLQQVLHLPDLPKKIVCLDISHTMGEETVGSYVVFTQAGALKHEYRRYPIDGIVPGDDYAAMRYVLTRRFTQLSVEKRPDVILIDGGLGQLHQAEQVLAELNIHDLVLIGVAKGKERKPGKETLWLSGKKEPIEVVSTSMAFHLIQQVRDEAHRFALAGHRLKRAKKRITSELEHIPGIGPKRRRALLNHFGGWQEVKGASLEALIHAPGMSRSLAEKIYNAFH